MELTGRNELSGIASQESIEDSNMKSARNRQNVLLSPIDEPVVKGKKYKDKSHEKERSIPKSKGKFLANINNSINEDSNEDSAPVTPYSARSLLKNTDK